MSAYINAQWALERIETLRKDLKRQPKEVFSKQEIDYQLSSLLEDFEQEVDV